MKCRKKNIRTNYPLLIIRGPKFTTHLLSKISNLILLNIVINFFPTGFSMGLNILPSSIDDIFPVIQNRSELRVYKCSRKSKRHGEGGDSFWMNFPVMQSEQAHTKSHFFWEVQRECSPNSSRSWLSSSP